MRKIVLIISIITILVIWKVRVKKEIVPTVLVEKIVNGRELPRYYFLLEDNKGEIIEKKVDYQDYAIYKIGDLYLHKRYSIYIK